MRLIALLDTEQCSIKTQTPALMISPNRLQNGNLIASPLCFDDKLWHNLSYRLVMTGDCWGIILQGFFKPFLALTEGFVLA